MNSQLLAFVGRILFGVPLLIFGFFHFMGAEDMAGMVPIPGAVFWVYLTGVALILAGLAILIDKMIQLATVLLALMLLVFILAVHVPGVMNAQNEMMKQLEMINIMKNLAMMGGALAIGAFYGKDSSSS